MDRMPQVTHVIYVPGYKPVKNVDLPGSVKVLSMAEVETMGALPENRECQR